MGKKKTDPKCCECKRPEENMKDCPECGELLCEDCREDHVSLCDSDGFLDEELPEALSDDDDEDDEDEDEVEDPFRAPWADDDFDRDR